MTKLIDTRVARSPPRRVGWLEAESGDLSARTAVVTHTHSIRVRRFSEMFNPLAGPSDGIESLIKLEQHTLPHHNVVDMLHSYTPTVVQPQRFLARYQWFHITVQPSVTVSKHTHNHGDGLCSPLPTDSTGVSNIMSRGSIDSACVRSFLEIFGPSIDSTSLSLKKPSHSSSLTAIRRHKARIKLTK